MRHLFKTPAGRFARGMRRLAVLTGIIGLVAGSSIAYFQFEELARVRAQHDRFETLLAARAMAPFVKTAAAVRHELSSRTGARLEDRVKRVTAAMDQAKTNGLGLKFDPGENSWWSLTEIPETLPPGEFREPVDYQLLYRSAIVLPGQYETTAMVDSSGKIISVRLSGGGGEVISDSPTPNWSKYAGALAFAPLGFLIPWGCVRLIAWTVAGFLPPISIGDPQ
jgi:hypothetical protein